MVKFFMIPSLNMSQYYDLKMVHAVIAYDTNYSTELFLQPVKKGLDTYTAPYEIFISGSSK